MLKSIVLLSLVAICYSIPHEDQVDYLPMMNEEQNFPFRMYSGYLKVLGTTKNLHYMYIES